MTSWTIWCVWLPETDHGSRASPHLLLVSVLLLLLCHRSSNLYLLKGSTKGFSYTHFFPLSINYEPFRFKALHLHFYWKLLTIHNWSYMGWSCRAVRYISQWALTHSLCRFVSKFCLFRWLIHFYNFFMQHMFKFLHKCCSVFFHQDSKSSECTTEYLEVS